VIRLDSISKRHGKQILFLEASAAVERGEKVGLVGPNGAGKTTIFRLITRGEEPDGGQVAVDRGVSIGYFSQDVGEMRGKSVVAETMDGACRDRVRRSNRDCRPWSFRHTQDEHLEDVADRAPSQCHSAS
jgi:ATPase subunit of ABC transporter with duplicated ATPase domains